MPQRSRLKHRAALLLTLAMLTASPALADLQAGRLAFFAGDYATAFKEFNAAAEAGDSSGQYLAGEMLVQGRGMPKDVRRGLRMLEAAAKAGHVGAQSLVGALYAFGQDMPADYARALTYLRPAAQAGDMNAQNNLAALLYFGLGTDADIVDALHWAKRAAAKRLVAAIKLEREITSRATPDQIRAAEARAAEPLSPSTTVADTPPVKTEAPTQAAAIAASSAARSEKAPMKAAAPAAPPPPTATAAAPPPSPPQEPVETMAGTTTALAVTSPTPPPQPSPAPITAPTPPSQTGVWAIQVGSLPTRDEAEKHWKALAVKQAALIAGRQPTFVQADLGAKGIYTRVFMTGFADQATAASLCTRLKAAGADCLVKKGP